ncbi:MAG: rane protein insertase YidC, partial [Bacteroidota bacterium]
MDRKSLLGLGIIALLLALWMTMGNDDREADAKKQHEQDSIAKVEAIRQQQIAEVEKRREDSLLKERQKDTTFNLAAFEAEKARKRYGLFLGAAKGNNTPVVLENSKMKASIFPLGGKIGDVELKGVKTHSGQPLHLYGKDSTVFSLEFFDQQRRRVHTDSLFFQGTVDNAAATTAKPASAVFRLYADSSTTSYIEYKYTLNENDYMVSCVINFVGCDKIMAT